MSPRTRCGVLGAALAGCALLPVEADSGASVLDVLALLLQSKGAAVALLVGLTVGLPYVFGLLVLAHAATRGSFAAWGLRVAASLLMVEVFVLGLALAVRGVGMAPWALAGVSGSAVLARVAAGFSERASGRSIPPMFFVRWGAVLIAASFGWLRLQFVGDPTQPGIALLATCVCAALLAAAASPPPAANSPA